MDFMQTNIFKKAEETKKQLIHEEVFRTSIINTNKLKYLINKCYNRYSLHFNYHHVSHKITNCKSQITSLQLKEFVLRKYLRTPMMK